MADAPCRYVVAARRGVPESAAATLEAAGIDGVRVLGAANPRRVLVEATAEAAGEVERRLGGQVRIEVEITHRHQAPSAD